MVDVALAGDDEPTGVEHRDWVRRAQAATDVDTCLSIIASGVREIDERVADVMTISTTGSGVAEFDTMGCPEADEQP